MALSYRNRCQTGVTVVANEFIDVHMAKASGEYVKVYLYLLRRGGGAAMEDIASALELTEADVRRALAYWEKAGVLEADSEKTERPERAVSSAPDSGREAAAADGSWMRMAAAGKGAGGEAAAVPPAAGALADRSCPPELMGRLSGDDDFTQLLYIAQKYMNKVFTPRDCEVFGYLYGRLGMSAELLEFLVEYCAQAGHTSIRYVETVALSWHSRGITTVEEAKSGALDMQKDVFAVMRAFGLGDRRPGEAERAVIEKWFKRLGFSRELAVEACSRTLAAIHNPSFQYADKILTQWHDAGVRTMEDVKRLDEKRAAKNESRAEKERRPAKGHGSNRFHNYEQDSYDYDEMVWQMIREEKA